VLVVALVNTFPDSECLGMVMKQFRAPQGANSNATTNSMLDNNVEPKRAPFAVPDHALVSICTLSNELSPQGQNVPGPEHGITSGLQYHLHWHGFSRVPGAYSAICFTKYLRYRDCRIASDEIEFGIS